MEEVKKSVEFKLDGTKMLVLVDPNKDGDALLKFELDLSEMADEILDALGKK